MKKKLLILFAAVLAVLPAAAQSVTISYGEGQQQYSLTFTATGEGTASVSNFGGVIYGQPVAVVIPGEVEIGSSTYTVTSFGDAFKNSGYVSSLVIPGSITTIGSYALEKCGNMTSLEIHDGLQSIDGGAFNQCSKLAAIKLHSATPPTIATGVNPSFPSVPSTCTVTVPYGTEEAYQNSNWGTVFSNFTSIASVIQDGMKFTITSAADKTAKVAKADDGTSGAIVIPTSVTIDGVDYTVTEIAAASDGGFSDTQITSIAIPETVTTIGENAFLRCNSLTEVTGCSGLTTIGWSGFGGLAIRSIELGENLTNIAGLAFGSCSSLEQITLHATTPPAFDATPATSSFSGVPSTVKVCVPYSAYDTYAATDWANVGVLQCEVQPKGNGSSTDPFLVGTPEELLWISLRVNDGTQSAYFYTELTDDIDLKGRNWTPIGTATHSFLGSFDGKGHSITNMKIVATADYQGLFGKANGPGTTKIYIKNLNLAGTITTDDNPHTYIGGLVGMSQGMYSNVRNQIENVHSSVNITSDQNLAHVGGVVGNNKCTEIHRCSYSGEISLPNCNSCVAGIAGYTYYSNVVIDDCIFTGSVTISESGNQCGGILGYVNSSFNSVQIKNNLSLGTISPQCGMIIGEAKEAIEGCMTNNYAPEGTTLYGGAQAANCQGATVTADQLKSGEVCWLLNGSTASGAWHQTIGEDDTPVLDPMHATVYSETQTIDAPAQNAYLLSFCRHMDGTVTGAKVYEFAGIHGTDVYGTLVSGGKIQAGKPYILVLDQAGASYKFDSGYSNDWTTSGLAGEYGIQAVLEEDCYIRYGETYDYYLACYDSPSQEDLVFSQNKIMRAKSLSNGGTKVAIGKCYIDGKSAFITTPQAAPVRLTFFDETTGIEDVTETGASPIGQTYNLQGVRVGTDYKGIVIINGKKVLRK